MGWKSIAYQRLQGCEKMENRSHLLFCSFALGTSFACGTVDRVRNEGMQEKENEEVWQQLDVTPRLIEVSETSSPSGGGLHLSSFCAIYPMTTGPRKVYLSACLPPGPGTLEIREVLGDGKRWRGDCDWASSMGGKRWHMKLKTNDNGYKESAAKVSQEEDKRRGKQTSWHCSCQYKPIIPQLQHKTCFLSKMTNIHLFKLWVQVHQH